MLKEKHRLTLSSVSEESKAEQDSSCVSFYISAHGCMLTEPCEKVLDSPQLRSSVKIARASNIWTNDQRALKCRKVRLWGNQKGVDVNKDWTKNIVADVINRTNEERERFINKCVQTAKESEASKEFSQQLTPEDSPVLQPRRSIMYPSEKLEVVSVNAIVEPASLKRPTRLWVEEPPTPQEKRVLYEPPPECFYLKKFLSEPKPARKKVTMRVQSDMKFLSGRQSERSPQSFSSLQQRRDFFFPSIHRMRPARLSPIAHKKQPDSPIFDLSPATTRGHVKTRSLITMRQTLVDSV